MMEAHTPGGEEEEGEREIKGWLDSLSSDIFLGLVFLLLWIVGPQFESYIL